MICKGKGSVGWQRRLWPFSALCPYKKYCSMLCIYEKIIYGFEARFMQIIEGIRNLFISNRIKLNQVQLYYLIKWILVLKITLKGKWTQCI